MTRIVIIGFLAWWAVSIFFTIALLLACAMATARKRGAGVTRRRVRPYGLLAEAGDPFFFPFGEMPTVPRERLMAARDFRAWGIPDTFTPSPVALRRNESGGRPASHSGTAVVLNFPGVLSPREAEMMKITWRASLAAKTQDGA